MTIDLELFQFCILNSALKLLLCNPKDFLDGGDTFKDLSGAVMTQGNHAVFHGKTFYGIGIGSLEDEALYLIIYKHELKNALTAAITGLLAGRTPLVPV